MKLTKKEREILGGHEQLLRASEADVQRLFNGLLRMLVTVVGPVNQAITTYNGVVKNAADFCSEIATRARETYDEKSERWQEGDAGQALDSFAEDWEGLHFHLLSEIVIVAPELEEELCLSDRLKKLPTETDCA